MTYIVKAQGVLRAMRDGLARLNRLLLEAGSSEEDLAFHIRDSEFGQLAPRSATAALSSGRATS